MKLRRLRHNLHHSSGRPDWADVAVANRWQRLAMATQGVITPGNIASLIGLLLLAGGLVAVMVGHLLAAFLLVLGGRLCDIADGWLAEVTATKSPLGEAVDATFDKLGALATLCIFGLKAVAPWWVVIAVLVLTVVTIGVSLWARKRHVVLRPLSAGKWGTVGEWAGFSAFLLAALYGDSWLWPAYICVGFGFGLKAAATIGYGRVVLATASAISASNDRRA